MENRIPAFSISLHSFRTTVTGVCFVPPIRTIWIAAGTSDVPMFDPKSGDNVCLYCFLLKSIHDIHTVMFYMQTARFLLVVVNFKQLLHGVLNLDLERYEQLFSWNLPLLEKTGFFHEYHEF